MTLFNPQYSAPLIKVSLLCGYMPFYDKYMPEDYKDKQLQWGKKISDFLSVDFDVDYFGLIDDYTKARIVADKLLRDKPDVIVIAPPMPSPAGFLWEAIRNYDVPVIILGGVKRTKLEKNYNSQDHLDASGNVGVTMISNMLSRFGRCYSVVSGLWPSPKTYNELAQKIKSLSATAALRKAKFGVFGTPLEAYDNILVDPSTLKEKIGAQLINISSQEFTNTYKNISEAAIKDFSDCLQQQTNVRGMDSLELNSSCRLALTLHKLAIKHDLQGGTFNSHLEYSHLNPEIGLVGGLANSALTSIGLPFTDTGDTITPIAMWIGNRLSMSSLYSELNTIDADVGAILCANTGEGDFRMTENASYIDIRSAHNSTGKKKFGCIVQCHLKPGPATMLGFSPCQNSLNGFKIIAMEGDILDDPQLDLNVTHYYFRPKRHNKDPFVAFSHWAEAGATHHASLSLGHISQDIIDLAKSLNIGVEIIQDSIKR